MQVVRVGVKSCTKLALAVPHDRVDVRESFCIDKSSIAAQLSGCNPCKHCFDAVLAEPLAGIIYLL
jgi:hypothetical protein